MYTPDLNGVKKISFHFTVEIINLGSHSDVDPLKKYQPVPVFTIKAGNIRTLHWNMQVVHIVTTVTCRLRTRVFNLNRRSQVRMRVTQLLHEPVTVQIDQMSNILA